MKGLVTSQKESLSDKLCELASLTSAEDGLCEPNIKAKAPLQYGASKLTIYKKSCINSIK